MKKLLIPILVIVALAFLFLPQLLSTPMGKQFIEDAMEKKFRSEISIGSAHLSWFGPQVFQKVTLSNPDMSGTIESVTSNVPLWSLSDFGNAFVLKDGIFTFPKVGAISVGPVNAKFGGHEIEAVGTASQGGSFTVAGKIYSKTDFDLTAHFKDMPSVAIDQLVQAKGIFNAAVGPSFNLDGELVYNQSEGIVKAYLSSLNATLFLQGEIAQDALLLKEPLTASLNFSPELADTLGRRIVGARTPITLRIETAGASIPLRPFALERLEIGQATLDLGNLTSTQIPPLVSLLALLHRNTSSTGSIWLTPATFSIDKGQVSVGRVDALVESAVHLCAWGQMRIPSGSLDMRVGIPADTLQEALGINNLPRNYVLQIPVRGTIRNPEYDTTSAAAKIAAMVAGQQIQTQVSKKAGGLLRGLFNQFAVPVGEDESVPPPNRPFPWER